MTIASENFSGLNVARFDVRLRALESVSLPPFLGSTLRGAFGHALKLAVCVVDHGDCSRCPVARQCVYPYLFETPVPPSMTQLRGQRHAPLPFILEPPVVINPVRRVWKLSAASAQESTTSVAVAGRNRAAARREATITSVVFPDQPKRYSAKEDLSFGLMLVGRAIELVPYVVFAIAEMARRGLGVKCKSFELKEVSLKGPAGARERIYSSDSSGLTLPPQVSWPLSELIAERLSELETNKAANSENGRIARSAEKEPMCCSRTSRPLEEAVADGLSELRFKILETDGSGHRELITPGAGTEREYDNGRHRRKGHDAKPEKRLKLRFLTPARIRVKGDLQTGLSFELLVRNLLRRVSALTAVHGRNRLELDYRDLIERTASVKTRQSLRWWDLERYSNRHAERLKVGGIIGDVEYEGEVVEDYLPLVVAGELLRIGTGASYGLGRYELSRN